MAEKDHHEQESSATNQSKELKKKKRIKCLLYIFLFAVSHAIIMIVFTLTILKIRTPKFRLTSAAFGSFRYSAAASNPSFNIMIIAELSVKNRNFGRFKFRDSNISFYYNDVVVGSAFVPSGRAGARSTRRFAVAADLSSAGFSDRAQLSAGLGSGVLLLKSRSKLRGNVGKLVVLKKKSSEMDCDIAINLAKKIVGDLSCI
ncbi:hypothetical protein ACS0TY_004607 [Phlomoides rotata]